MRTLILTLILPLFLLPLVLFAQNGSKHVMVPKDVRSNGSTLEYVQAMESLQPSVDLSKTDALFQQMLDDFKPRWYAIEGENDPVYWENVETDKLLIEFNEGYGIAHPAIRSFLSKHNITQMIRQSHDPEFHNWAQYHCQDCGKDEVLSIVRAAQNAPSIMLLEPTPIYTVQACDANDALYSDQWGPEAIRIDSSWCYYTGGGVHWMAVLDDAIDLEHEDHSNIHASYDFAEEDNDARPDSDAADHGTHVAGTACATLNNNLGVAGMVNDSTFFGKLGDVNDNLDGAGIIDAVDSMAKRNMVFVVNMSYGGGSGGGLNEIAYQNLFQNDKLGISSSGNDNSGVSYPAKYDYVQACGAMAYNGNSYLKASYSNFGPEIEIMAPGGSANFPIWSTTPDDTYNAESSLGGPWNGTSMASPHATGGALLVKATNPALTALKVRQILNNTAQDFGDQGFDNTYGNGMVDIFAAAEEACAQFELGIQDDGSTLTNTADDLSMYKVIYNWLRDDEIIFGANAQSYTPAQDGATYKLMATTPGGCVTITDGTTITNTVGVAEGQLGFGAQLYPNPASAVLTLEHSAPAGSQLEIELVDLLGRKQLTDTFAGSGAKQTEQLDVAGLAKGVYLVKLTHAGQTQTTRIIIAE